MLLPIVFRVSEFTIRIIDLLIQFIVGLFEDATGFNLVKEEKEPISCSIITCLLFNLDYSE